MFNRKLSAFAVAALLAAAGGAQAASPFPSAAEEGSGLSVNALLPAGAGTAVISDAAFPSAAKEGGEADGRYVEQGTPRKLHSSYARGSGNVFPGSAME